MSELYKVIRVFDENDAVGSDKAFSIEDRTADFENRPDVGLYVPEVNWQELAKVYGLKESSEGEKILNLSDLSVFGSRWDNFNFDIGEPPAIPVNWITSYEIKAFNKGYFGDKKQFLPVAVQGILKTREGQIVFGVRGGKITPETKETIGRGLYGVLPAGYVTFNPVDPVIKAIRKEFQEEVGDFEITSEKIMGIFEAYRPGPMPISFVCSLSTDATFEQIFKRHKESNDLYQNLTEKGASKSEVARELRSKNLPPDAWEHSVLLSIQDDKKSIETLVNSQPQSFTGIGAGALMTYADSLN